MKEEKYIYRFISFEKFVDMIQKQSLAFVHPCAYEDPYETVPISLRIQYKRSLLLFLFSQKIYTQSWTVSRNCDALWRLYSNNNFSVKLSVSKKDVESLGVHVLKVKYTDDLENVVKNMDDRDFLQLFAIKRTAFSFENEIRLIDSRGCTDNIEERRKGAILYCDDKRRDQVIKDNLDCCSGEKIIKKVEKYIQSFDNVSKYKDVSFAGIDDFVRNVEVNPLAPDWFIGTVEHFCSKNGLKNAFVGKSPLYSRSQDTFWLK